VLELAPQAFGKGFQALEKLEQILIKLFSKKFKSERECGGVRPRSVAEASFRTP